jgi:hypothetical protein
MARIRSVHPGLASDEAYMTMSMAAKAAWPLLWTECDDHGIFEWKPIVLKARIFPADAVDFAAILDEYEALGCVRRVEIAGKSCGLVRNFGKFQRPKNPSYRYEWSNDFASFTGFPVVLPQPSPSPTEKRPQMKEEGGRRERETEEAIASSSHEAKLSISEMVRRLEQATGWLDLPGKGAIEKLVEEGHSFEGRILPLARDEAERRDKPNGWTYLAAVVRDQTRTPTAAAKPVEMAWVPVGSAYWKALTSRKKESYLRLMVKTDGSGREGINWPMSDLPPLSEAAA